MRIQPAVEIHTPIPENFIELRYHITEYVVFKIDTYI